MDYHPTLLIATRALSWRSLVSICLNTCADGCPRRHPEARRCRGRALRRRVHRGVHPKARHCPLERVTSDKRRRAHACWTRPAASERIRRWGSHRFTPAKKENSGLPGIWHANTPHIKLYSVSQTLHRDSAARSASVGAGGGGWGVGPLGPPPRGLYVVCLTGVVMAHAPALTCSHVTTLSLLIILKPLARVD